MTKNKRILHIANFDTRVEKPNPSYYSTDRKISLGFIRNDHIVREFCYNDLIRMNSLIGSKKAFRAKGLQLLVNTVESFEPEIIVIGHADIPVTTLQKIKQICPQVMVIAWSVDVLQSALANRFNRMQDYIDVLFLTTGGQSLRTLKAQLPRIAKLGFFPNPVDQSTEFLRSFSQDNYEFDAMYCGADSRSNSNRTDFFRTVTHLTPQFNWFFAGLMGKPKVYGKAYYEAMSKTSFAINISQFHLNNFHYYSSDRIAQLIGNGLLTFNQKFPGINELMGCDEQTTFETPEELASKLKYFKNNPTEAKALAQEHHDQYHKHYSAKRICRYFTDVLEGRCLDEYHWSKEIYVD